MDIDYEVLEQFVAFSELGTLLAVSERFYTSQPTVTRNMKKAEELFGVPLFTRTKNQISLNENGIYAAKEASTALKSARDMIANVKAYDRANHTIAIGSCIALPIPEIIGKITSNYPDYAVMTEIKLPKDLLDGLYQNQYQLIILPYKPDSEKLVHTKIGEEHLNFCLPKNHKLANRKTLSLSDLNGEDMLLYKQIGFWDAIVKEKMPDTHFIVQDERLSLEALMKSTNFPCFNTDLSIQMNKNYDMNFRVNIPITDPEVNVNYYLVCKKTDRQRFHQLLV